MTWIKNILKEFRDFAVKGNVIDLAVGLVIGASFNSIINSLVNDIINPIVGVFTGHVNFSSLFIALSKTHYSSTSTALAAKVPVLTYGNFINTVVNFLIVAFVIFLVVKEINKFKRRPPPPESTTKLCPYCHTNIPKEANRCPNCTSQLSENHTS